MAKIGDTIRRLNDFYPFQKPATKVRYDSVRDRVIAGGLDSQLKFFEISGTDRDQLSVAYKIKVPSEIFAFDVSADGSHIAFGLNDCSLVVKSKRLEETAAEMDPEQRLLAQFEPKLVSTSKNYKYFNRGQYTVTPDAQDLQTAVKQRSAKLQAYEQSLKKFEYKLCLSKALETNNPEVVLALFEELAERGALFISLANRTEDELCTLLKFI